MGWIRNKINTKEFQPIPNRKKSSILRIKKAFQCLKSISSVLCLMFEFIILENSNFEFLLFISFLFCFEHLDILFWILIVIVDIKEKKRYRLSMNPADAPSGPRGNRMISGGTWYADICWWCGDWKLFIWWYCCWGE